MKKTDRRKRERVMFAAPIVATAVFGAGCAGRVYENPGPPTETPPETTATATAEPTETAAPAASGSAAPTEALQDPPKDGGGQVVAQADGTCLYVFPEPKDNCPPTAHCNPGPPQAPLRVKCPDGKKKP